MSSCVWYLTDSNLILRIWYIKWGSATKDINIINILFLCIQYLPPVDGRARCGFVGLKNGGATCYMNSVIQQLYLAPSIPENILAVEEDNPDEERYWKKTQNIRTIFISPSLFRPLLNSPSLTYLDPTYPDTCFGTNYDYIEKVTHLSRYSFIWIFIYLDIQLSGQSTWERRCPYKWGSTVNYIL